MRCLLGILAAAALAAGGEYATLAEATGALRTALAEKAAGEAANVLATLPGLYGKASEADRADAVKAAGKAAGSKDLRVRHGAFAALGEMRAKGSSKYLGRWLKPPKRFKSEIPPSYVEAIKAAGSIADLGSLSNLTKLSDHSELTIATSATVALGGFHGTLSTKRRKALAFDLIDRLERLSAKQRRKASEEVYARKAELAAATIAALQRLTGVKRETVDGWKRWREGAARSKDPFN